MFAGDMAVLANQTTTIRSNADFYFYLSAFSAIITNHPVFR